MKTRQVVRALLIFVGLSGAFSVLFGAWLAHGGKLLPSESYTRLNTALYYQQLHTLAMLAVFACYQYRPSNWFFRALVFYMLGIVFFSGSLYIKTFFELNLIGKLSPLGGILLAIAWLLLIPASKQLLGKTHS